MDGLTWSLILLAYVLTVARLTRLVNADVITDPLRIAVARKWGAQSTVSYFLGCAWCVSLWVALVLAVATVAVTGVSWWWIVLMAPAASHITGLLTGLDTDDVEIVDD